ncbi:MAG: hypothetical protein HQL76_14875 [Magnetococcales bacterium]|nr:hypothetical protein [Magnetococcales bacterium]
MRPINTRRYLRWLAALALPLMVSGVNAEEEKQGKEAGPGFQQAKEHQIQMTEKKLACLKNATSRSDLKQCHEAAREDHKKRAREKIQEQRRRLDEQEKQLDANP